MNKQFLKVLRVKDSFLNGTVVRIVKESKHKRVFDRTFTVEVVEGPHKGCIEVVGHVQLGTYLRLVG